ncbi:hypothetical protein LCGC14_0415660 [marine sediment metagenome]|uniref:Uncharacterized protein n=1 Tax=marine sediment metagenome TaxID=412755 RepID=A0A0F9SSF8_9ZZZZ
MTKVDLIAVITKAYFPKNFDYDNNMKQVKRFTSKQNRMVKADLIDLARTACDALEQRGE